MLQRRKLVQQLPVYKNERVADSSRTTIHAQGDRMDISRITAQEIDARIKRGQKIQFVDSRAPKVWNDATTKLPGAVRVPPDEPEKHIANVGRDRVVVTYCT
jgi:hypothetical protein